MSSDTVLLIDNHANESKSSSILVKYEAIIVGDAYCGKTTYLNQLIKEEHDANSPIILADDNNKLEFCVEYNSKKAVFTVRDTASMW